MYKFELPSGEEIELRSFTGTEELILTDQRLIKSGEAINKVFLNCIESIGETKPVSLENILDMLAGDRLFSLVKLREISYGNEVNLENNCINGCGVFHAVTNIDDLPVTYYKNKREFSFTMPQSNKIIVFKHLDGHMEQRLVKLKKTNIHSSMLMRIVSIDEQAPNSKTLTNLPSFDLAALRKEMSMNDAGINTITEMECPICGLKHKIRLETQSSFLYPGLIQ